MVVHFHMSFKIRPGTKKRKMDSPQRIILHFTGFQKKPIIRNLLTLKYRYLKYVFVLLLILLTNIVLKIVKWFFLCKTKKSIKMQITSPYLSFLYTQRKMTLFWGTLWGKEKKEEDQSRFTIFFYIQAPTISHYYKQYKTGYSRLPGFFFYYWVLRIFKPQFLFRPERHLFIKIASS